MNGQEAFRRLAQQIQRAGGGGGGPNRPGPKGLLTGGGLVVALIGGGLALNASLFNGASWSCHTILNLCSHAFSVDGGHRAIKYTR